MKLGNPQSLVRASVVMSGGTVLSRVTGMVRLIAITAALGVAESRLADAYNLANTVPNIIYQLILGGILGSVFVPVIVELLEKEDRETAWEAISAMINLSVVILTAVTLLGILAAPVIASFYAARLEGAQAELQFQVMTFLLRLFAPQVIFYGLAAITASLLNAHKRFGARCTRRFSTISSLSASSLPFIAFSGEKTSIPARPNCGLSASVPLSESC